MTRGKNLSTWGYVLRVLSVASILGLIASLLGVVSPGAGALPHLLLWTPFFAGASVVTWYASKAFANSESTPRAVVESRGRWVNILIHLLFGAATLGLIDEAISIHRRKPIQSYELIAFIAAAFAFRVWAHRSKHRNRINASIMLAAVVLAPFWFSILRFVIGTFDTTLHDRRAAQAILARLKQNQHSAEPTSPRTCRRYDESVRHVAPSSERKSLHDFVNDDLLSIDGERIDAVCPVFVGQYLTPHADGVVREVAHSQNDTIGNLVACINHSVCLSDRQAIVKTLVSETDFDRKESVVRNVIIIHLTSRDWPDDVKDLPSVKRTPSRSCRRRDDVPHYADSASEREALRNFVRHDLLSMDGSGLDAVCPVFVGRYLAPHTDLVVRELARSRSDTIGNVVACIDHSVCLSDKQVIMKTLLSMNNIDRKETVVRNKVIGHLTDANHNWPEVKDVPSAKRTPSRSCGRRDDVPRYPDSISEREALRYFVRQDLLNMDSSGLDAVCPVLVGRYLVPHTDQVIREVAHTRTDSLENLIECIDHSVCLSDQQVIMESLLSMNNIDRKEAVVRNKVVRHFTDGHRDWPQDQ